MHCGGMDRLLQLRPSQADRAAATPRKATHPLRNRAFRPGSQRLLRLELLRLLPLARGLDRLVLRLRPHRELARRIFRRP
jgi:hypothetical protein